MTQEERQLLLKDLCARLPYGIVCRVKFESDFEIPYETDVILSQHNISYVFDLGYEWLWCKPYLRPMSSMTKEERVELKDTTCPNGTGTFDEQYLNCPMNHFGERIGYDFMSDILDWLNSHHFDYCGLIEKGLALEAPEDMYKEIAL